MVRLVKRYESRKLYDTEESRYVSLEEIGRWVRGGQDVQVIDNASSDDVTAQTLAQVILEEGKSGRSRLPSELLHELIRRGEDMVSSGVERVQAGVDRLVEASVDRIGPVRNVRQEMRELRERLEELEASMRDLETAPQSEAASGTEKRAGGKG
jgi:polyhydroxyalkanoate synthesis repressor PhaR